MRVIAGLYKGTKLISPRGEVRPTTDLVKGSLFSVLQAKGILKEGVRCLDVFCGSGSLGIEALSRGAKDCVFVDMNTDNAAANLDKLRLKMRLVRGDFRKSLRLLKNERFDIVFCDPPYKSGFGEQALKLLVKYGMLGENGVAVIERAIENSLLKVDKTCIIDSRSFGASAFDIVRGDNEGDICGSV
ncbi:MAG: 16S rRNA (guanine(966)-N(2))-methyltransferase RsmD [Clostridiales bacterium]|nr:16S rRNA (guanine(966)-N(2))-methyltransferase RsmD [Clostridiales bacterium]